MTKDSTSYLKSDVKTKIMKTPRQSTIAFIRQFARAYIYIGNSERTAISVN